MKSFLIASVLWTVAAQAQAQAECSTIWIYKPWKICAQGAGGPDKNAPPIDAGTLDLNSDYMRGGRDQRRVCQNLENSFNQQNASHGKVGTLTQPTPVAEDVRKNAGIYVEYRYTCRISIAQYPMLKKASRACGEEDRIAYKVGGTREGIEGDAYCLTCDEYSDLKNKVACLKMMITEVVEPKAQGVDLRESDLQAMSATVRAIISIPGLKIDEKAKTVFDDFLEKNPAR